MEVNVDSILPIVVSELTRPVHFPDYSFIDFQNTIITAYEQTYIHRREPLGTVRIENYVGETVPRYSDPLFKAHFRMTRTSFQTLLEMIAPHTDCRTVSLETRTLACLWYLSNQETFRSVVDRFGMSKGSMHYYLGQFCRTITGSEIMPQLISWPKTTDYAKLADMASVRAGFPGVVGMLDGSYIPIPGPSSFRDSYICRKGFPAMHLQGVCDSSLRFMDVYCAYPGSAHDSRVYRNSPLKQYLDENPFPDKYHLLGDSAYALSNSLLVPFRDNGHLTLVEKKYNYVHSSTRVDIERCFGLLKGKFRKLKFLDMKNVKDMPGVIIACCVLHNFILNKEAFEETDIYIGDIDALETEETNTEVLSARNSERCCETSQSGFAKRLAIAQLLV